MMLTAQKVYDMAFKYIEEIRETRPIDNNFFHDACIWFKNQGGSDSLDYAIFIDLTYVYLKNHYELLLSDIYSHYPDWS